MRSRMLAGVALGVACATVLMGCSAGDSGSGGTITLNMIQEYPNPPRTELLKTQLAEFEKANPGIKVNLITPPTDSAVQKMQTMLQSKSGLDVLEVDANTVGPFSANGWLYDITKDAEAWSGWSDVTDGIKAAAVQKGGKYYDIPYGSYVPILFYRKDLVKQAGFDGPPNSWSDVIKQSEAINDPSANVYGFGFRGGANAAYLLATPIQSVNSKDLDHSNAYFLKNGKTIFSTPEAVKMTADWLELFKKGSPPSSIAWGYPEMVQGFSSGIVGFLVQTQEVIATVAESQALKPDQWGTAPQPVGPNGDSPIVAAQGGWSVASSSKHTAESVKLVQFLTEAPQVIDFQKKAGYVPSVKSAAKDEFFSTGAWAPYLYMNEHPEIYPSVTEPRNAAWWSAWLVKSNNDMQSLLLGNMTPAQMMSDWDAYWIDKTKAAG